MSGWEAIKGSATARETSVSNSTTPKSTPSDVVITKFRPSAGGSKSTLRCHVDVQINSDYLRIFWVGVHESGGLRWVSLPHQSAEHRAKYFRMPLPYIDEMGRRAFERAVIAAVRAEHPEAFAGAETVA